MNAKNVPKIGKINENRFQCLTEMFVEFHVNSNLNLTFSFQRLDFLVGKFVGIFKSFSGLKSFWNTNDIQWSILRRWWMWKFYTANNIPHICTKNSNHFCWNEKGKQKLQPKNLLNVRSANQNIEFTLWHMKVILSFEQMLHEVWCTQLSTEQMRPLPNVNHLRKSRCLRFLNQEVSISMAIKTEFNSCFFEKLF